MTGDGGLGRCKLYDPDVITARLNETLETHKRVRPLVAFLRSCIDRSTK